MPLRILGGFALVPILFLLIMPLVMLNHDPLAAEGFAPRPPAFKVFGLCLLAPGVLLALLVTGLLIGAARTKVRIHITSHEIRVAYGLTTTTIPLQRLEEVGVNGTGRGWSSPCFITLRSAAARAQFGGNGLTREECEYLAAIIKALAAKAAMPA